MEKSVEYKRQNLKYEKVYSVKFRQYCTALNTQVSNAPEDGPRRNSDQYTYLNTKGDPIIIRESDLDYFRTYGYGFLEIKYIGQLVTYEGDE